MKYMRKKVHEHAYGVRVINNNTGKYEYIVFPYEPALRWSSYFDFWSITTKELAQKALKLIDVQYKPKLVHFKIMEL